MATRCAHFSAVTSRLLIGTVEGSEYHIKHSDEIDMSVVVFPAKVVWTVKEISGNAAVLENGKKISVPHIIRAGDKISIRLPEEAYSHRANNEEEEGATDEDDAEASEEQEEEERK